MNIIHRSIWNDQTGTFVAVSENTRSAGKKISSCTSAAGGNASFSLKILAVSLMMACGAGAQAQPVGGVVSAGSATIGGTAGNMTITQTTPNVAINWQSFGIQAGQSVQFVQPGSSSVALNRVIGANPSNILGTLSANGKVFLVNPNGILFGQGASVNVGGLVASTLAISDANFMASNYQFSGAGAGTVLNQGTINAADGGYVALLGANVSNQGVISAQLGTVALAAGNAVTLDVAGDKLLNIAVDQGAVNALVDNGGLIRADGGQVLMTTQAAGSLLSNAVNNTGVVQAQTLQNVNGTIKLLGGMENGTVNAGGTLDASAPNGGNGGFIETSAAYVKVANDVKVTTLASAGQTGTWLIDPFDYTVASGGGDITGAQLGTNLDSTNVTIESIAGAAGTLGNVNVNDPVSWTGTTTLTMNAVNDVNINQAITGINGSVNAIAGHDVNVAAAAKTTTGTLKFTAVNDVAMSAATTIITGDMTAVAGRNVTVSAASTITTGSMILRADNDGTGPGVAAGTVAITCGSNCLTITTGNLSIRFNPVSYASTAAEIIAYGNNLTGAGVLDAKAWVFGKGDNKMYDGTTAATVSGLKPDALGVAPSPALGAVSNAQFNTKHVGTNKPITFETVYTDPVYQLFAPFGTVVGTYLARADITVRPLTISAVTDTKQYDGTTSSVGVPTVATLQVGDTLNGALTQTFASKNVLGTNGSTLVATGPYTVTDGNGGANYSVTVNNALGTITPALLTLKADDNTKVYGQTFTPLGTAFTVVVPPVAGETVTGVAETTTGTAPTVSVTGSPYPIVITPGSATGNAAFNQANYTITYQNGALLVNPAQLTLKANDNTKVYGQTFTPLGTAFTVVVAPQNGETVTGVTETTTGTAATVHVAGSPYPITITPGSETGTVALGNYNVTLLPGQLTVTPAPLTLTANDQSKVYGTALPIPGTAFTATPLQNADSIASVTMTSAGTPATAHVAGSPYPITITPGSETGGTFVPTDYTVNYVPGKMVVTPAPLTLTANDQSKVYGTALPIPGTAFTATPLQNADSIASVTMTSAGTPATAHVAGSPYPITITPGSETGGTFVPTDYTVNYVPGKMVVTPAPLTLSANDQSKVYGTALPIPGTAFTSTTLQNSDAIDSVTMTSTGTPATATVAGSPYPITITPGSETSGTFVPTDYTVNYVPGKMVLTPVAVTPPVVTPPVVTPPVVTPPVVTPPVVTPPVVTPPVNFPPPVIQPVPPTPIPPVPVPPSEVPLVVVPPAAIPPTELRIVQPPAPVVVPVEVPVVRPAEKPPQPYVPPVYIRKQDRN